MALERVEIEVLDLEFDETNIEHLAREGHGVTIEAIYEVLFSAPRFFLNVPGRGGTHVMIGPDNAGRFYRVSLVERGEGRWRPITGWTMNRRRALKIYNAGGE